MFHASAPLSALDALYDIEALRTLESRAAAVLEDAYEPMRRAGQAAWRESLRHWPEAQRLLVVCGPGNNGGDGYMFARHAHQSGRRVSLMQWSDQPPRSPLARRACDEYLAAGGSLAPFVAPLPEVDLVVDALFGIGLARAPEPPAVALIDAINGQSAPVLALDVPSGVDANRGATPGAAVVATRTLEFIARKAGLRTGAAIDHAGVLAVADLALPAAVFTGVSPFAEALSSDDLARWLRPRRRDSHKGHHGRVLCVGGDHGHGGAIVLATEAALRSGAGLVDVVTRALHVPALLARVPEAMAHAIADDATRLPDALVEAASVIAIGP
ncbi:MAG TPA: NAD(P)H-hydrate epimerase, partial [Lysobacter sp.]|nr:NAD(P)H-hydrate epimerase [Lysobacter sp.]